MDETGLHWKHALYSTLAPKAMRHSSRMTLLLCVNSTGSDRLPVWVIASEKKPDSLDGLDPGASGAVWYSSESISMTSDPMQEWLSNFYSHIGSQRSVILLLDNLSAHQKGVRLAPPPSNIRIQWLPPGTTDRNQPLDQRVIRAFKSGYRKIWQMHIIEKMYKEPGNPIHTVSPELAVHWIVQIWKHGIKNQTIHKSFHESSVLQPQPPSSLASRDLPDPAARPGGFVDLSE
ncbi:hypothetical protein SI65_02088 [Aspergillus cristatus]|nr:hypothetical protein SI65_02088 [Aspergillus cristatus]